MTGQINLFEYLETVERAELEKKASSYMACSTCVCRGDGWTGKRKACEHWERGRCPVAAKRITVPYHAVDPYKNDCNGCHYAMREMNGAHAGRWSGRQHYKESCEHYMPSTLHTIQCLMYPIQEYKSDGAKWCAVCEANGCEDCYKKWEAAQDMEDE